MKVGVLQFFSWPERRVQLASVYERAMQRIAIMDRTGYDAVWLAEHHFTGYSVCPSVHMMGAHVAAHTRSLRIGMAVSLAAFYHPLRLAEEVAFLDILSQGRVNWGAGRGFDPTEFAAFGVPVAESGRRFHEAVEIVLAAWKSERLTWSGEFWKFSDIEVLPKPMQQPHPPVWLAAGSPGALKWAGRHGYTVMLGPHSTFEETAAHRELFRSELESAGHSIDGREIPMARFVAVAETDEAAEAIARSGAEWLAETYMTPAKATRPESADQEILTMDPAAKVARYLSAAIIHGSPGRVRERIARLRQEMYLDYLMLAPLSHGSFMAFTDEVMPHLR
jgi:alkanesulfonate monooxygenase SsuD/methylene tetrahydromethanopterin reductase-like flavin-dependent oxidoreductase (luciferase family)